MSDKMLAEITRLGSIVTNFDEGVRGVGIAIDITHDPDKGAAGWIKKLEISASSSKPGKQALWAEVDWTPMGEELIKLETFKYISSEFGSDTNGETKKITENVLRAATLTNRPFVKGLLAVELDEKGNPPTKIEILREGDFYHQVYGNFTIKADESKGSLVQRVTSAVLSVLGKETPSTLPKVLDEQTNETEEVEEMNEIRAYLAEKGVQLDEGADVLAALKTHIDSLETKIPVVVLDEEAAAEAVKLAEANVKSLAEAKVENIRLAEENKSLGGRVTSLEESGRIVARDAFLAQQIREGKMRPADLVKFQELYDVAPDSIEKLLTEGAVVVDLTKENGSDSDDTPANEDQKELKEAKATAAKDGITLEEAYIKNITSGE